jgi:hypothetical protein
MGAQEPYLSLETFMDTAQCHPQVCSAVLNPKIIHLFLGNGRCDEEELLLCALNMPKFHTIVRGSARMTDVEIEVSVSL